MLPDPGPTWVCRRAIADDMALIELEMFDVRHVFAKQVVARG